MRITLIAQYLAPEFEGGTEVVVRAQARALARRGHRVRVICGSERGIEDGAAEIERSELDGFEVVRIARQGSERGAWSLERPRVAGLVREFARGSERIHVHHWATLHGALVRELRALAPVVATVHDHFVSCPRFFRRSPGGVECPRAGRVGACADCLACDLPGVERGALVAGLWNRAQAFAAELAAASVVVAPSAAHAREVALAFGPSAPPIAVVPHGLCRSLVRSRTRVRARGAAVRALHFGHLGEMKGTLDLLRMLRLLPRGTVELVLAGASVEPAFAPRARELWSEHVRIETTYDDSSLSRLAAASDVALFPSRARESYGLVVDEALALGLPAWVSDDGAPAERVARLACGRALPAGAPRAWADALAGTSRRELAAQRARVPAELPTADDAALALERLYGALAA